jgi:hypothetical protein
MRIHETDSNFKDYVVIWNGRRIVHDVIMADEEKREVTLRVKNPDQTRHTRSAGSEVTHTLSGTVTVRLRSELTPEEKLIGDEDSPLR